MSALRFIIDHLHEIYDQTLEHIGLTLIACTIAVCIGVPLGIFLTRHKNISASVLGVAGVIQTIPSIALLGFLLPVLGIGVVPAIIALFLYALLPIIRNTFTGINEVDPAIREAAQGMGMSDGQILVKVELPLAVPVIFAGIRTATVINVGIATLCALIAAGGLGEFIFRGIALNNMNMILSGALPAALLALLFDFILSQMQKYIKTVIKPLLAGAAILLLVVIPFLVVPSFTTESFRAGFTAEFMERPDGYPGFKKHYDIFLNTVELDPGLMYKALQEGNVDIICGFSTDGRIEKYDLKVLKDDKHYFPPYHAAPLVHNRILQNYPEISDILSGLEGKISNEKMSSLNYLVDSGQKEPHQAAKEFLNSAGFKTSGHDRGSGDITIGSKNFTEQYILAHMFEIMIENYSDINAGVKTGLAGTKICFDALANQEISVYPEYTGTGLLVILDANKSVRDSLLQDSDELFDYVKTQTKERYNLVWLPPLGFNNTYAMMMRAEEANELGIETITDLKIYLENRPDIK